MSQTRCSQPVRALWEFVKEQHPDWILDLHEGYDFHITNSKSDGSTIICCNTPEMQELAGKICDEVNVAIDDPGRKFVTLSKNGPIEGGLVRATVERLGAKGLCLETTNGKQPMSTRTRQHRIMVHHLMRELGMVDGGSAHVIAATGESPCIRVALYDAGGTGGQGVRNLERILESGPAFTLHHIGPPDIRHGVLDQFDVLIVPGGSGSKEAAALGPDGRDAIRRFVAEGGGYVGICAGAYLATARYDWALGLLNAKTFAGSREIPGVGVKSMWLRGTGKVNIELTEEGKKILGDLPGLIELHYANGPVLSPAGREDLPEYLPLAVFRSEIAKYEPQRGTMIETPAIAASQYGRGRAMVISPHPEVVAGLETLVQRAVDWAGRKHAAAATPGEQH